MAKAPRYEGLNADTHVGEAARAILRALLKAVLAPAPAVLRGNDVRAVHDMRVAIRRLRSAMGTFADRFPHKKWRKLREGTKRIGTRLGEVRDADVHLAALRGARASASAAELPGIDFAIETLVARRRRALAEFAVEFSQFDRDGFTETLADA